MKKEIRFIGIDSASCGYEAADGALSMNICAGPGGRRQECRRSIAEPWRADIPVGQTDEGLRQEGPGVAIEFGLQRAGHLQFMSRFEIPASMGSNTGSSNGASATHPATAVKATNSEAAAKTIANAFSLACTQQIENKGYLHQPFLLRYALRMTDGNTVWASAPILMLPTVLPPALNAQSAPIEGTDSHVLTLSTNTYGYYQLRYRVLAPLAEEWQSKLAGIDIYATPPISTFDLADASAAGIRSYAECIDYDYDDDDDYDDDYNDDYDTDDDRRGREPGDTGHDVFWGRYSMGLDLYADHYINTADARAMRVWGVACKRSIADAIKSQDKYYRIATLSADIREMDTFSNLLIDCTSAESIVHKPQLADDLLMHLSPHPAGTAIVNARACYYGGYDTPAIPTSMRTAMGGATNYPSTPCMVTVLIKSGDQTIAATCDDQPAIALEDNFPRYIYYPHPGAYCAIVTQGSQTWKVPLHQHPTLPGSQWLGSMAGRPLQPTGTPHPDLSAYPTEMPTPNIMRIAKQGNPYALSHAVAVGSGSIITVRSALKAMAEGTFGQYPAYVFCTDGVWACGTDPTTLPTQLNRDRAYSASAIVDCEEGVAYGCAAGVVILKGAHRTVLSEALTANNEIETNQLPGIEEFTNHFGITLPLSTLMEILLDSKLCYHGRKRMLIVKADAQIAYAYSFATKQWRQIGEGCAQFALTRPIKLGAAKRVTAIEATGIAGSHCAIAAWGSNDLTHWTLMGSAMDARLPLYALNRHKYIIIGLGAKSTEPGCLHGVICTLSDR